MRRILIPLLLFLSATVYAANAISKAAYSFNAPNDKNIAYIGDNTSISLSLEVQPSINEPLPLQFSTADNDFIDITPTSTCISEDGTVVFRLENTLIANADTTVPVTCVLRATITPSSPNLEYTKLGIDASTAIDVPSFFTSGKLFTAAWSAHIAHAGESITLTLASDLLFAKADSFTITASNGAPFSAASACKSIAGDSNLFNVAALGNRLLFSARSAITSPFECLVTVTTAPTTLNDAKFIFVAPLHGLILPVDAFLCALDREDAHVRMGVVGATGLPVSSDAVERIMYMALPVDAVVAGDTVKLHFSTITNVEFKQCKYKDGSIAGTIKMTIEPHPIAKSFYAGVFTLASPLQATEEHIELFCDFTIRDVKTHSVAISAVSVPRGVLATAPFAGVDTAFTSHALLTEGVFPSFMLYNELFSFFKLSASVAHGAYSSVSADLSLRGVAFADVADVQDKCQFTRSDGSPLPASEVVTVTDGEARFVMDSAVIIAAGNSLSIECHVPVSVGQTVTAYDNHLDNVAIEENVHEGRAAITFAGGYQTHVMHLSALRGLYEVLIELDFDFEKFYRETGVGRFTTVQIKAISYDTQISASTSQWQKWRCYQGSVDESLSVSLSTEVADGVSLKYSTFTVKMNDGFTAKCRINVRLASFSQDIDDSKNYIQISMTEYAIRSHVHSSLRRNISRSNTYLPTRNNDAHVRYTVMVSLLHTHVFPVHRPGTGHVTTVRKNYQTLIKIPKVLTMEQFSFRGDVLPAFGVANTYTVGHMLLPAGGSFTFAFDSQAYNLSPTCAINGVNVLTCVLAADGFSFTCTKEDVQETTPCTMSVTFSGDYSHDITVQATFTGLPAGMVFSPKFTMLASAGMHGVSSPQASIPMGQEFQLVLKHLRTLTKDDVVVMPATVDGGELQFIRLEPTLGDGSASTYVANGELYIPLKSLGMTGKKLEPVTLYMRHVVNTQLASPGTKTMSIVLNKWREPVGPSFSKSWAFPTTRIVKVPSARSSINNIVKINHVDMTVGDSFTFHDLTYHPASIPTLRCDGVADIVQAVDGKFTLVSTVLASQPCYAIFGSYSLLRPNWRVAVTTNGAPLEIYATAATAPQATVTITSSLALVKDHARTATLTIPDFTTELVDQQLTTVNVFYDPADMSLTDVVCGSYPVTITTGSLSIDFANNRIPLASYTTITCTMTLLPLIASETPNVTINLLNSLAKVAVAPFQADYIPSLKLKFIPTALMTTIITFDIQITVDQMDIVAGDTLTIINRLPNGGFLSPSSCSSVASATSGKVTFSAARAASEPPVSFTCAYDAQYRSGFDIPFKMQHTRQDLIISEFDQIAPRAFKSSLIWYQPTLSNNAVVYRTEWYLSGNIKQKIRYSLANAELWPDVSLSSSCIGSQITRTTIDVFYFIELPYKETYACDMIVTFASDFDPEFAQSKMALLTDYDTQSVQLPPVQTAKPSIMARLIGTRIFLAFKNANTDSLTIENIWGINIPTTAPIVVFSAADGTTEVGQVSSQDKETLVVSFQSGFVENINGKYSIPTCLFDLITLQNYPLQSRSAEAKFTVGSKTIAIPTDVDLYSLASASSAAKLTPDAAHAVSMRLRVAGNKGQLILDYSNTALASPQHCATMVDTDDEAFSHPVEFTAQDGVLSFTLTDDTVFVGDSLYVGLKCVFQTVSVSDFTKNLRHYKKTIIVSIKSETDTLLFSTPVQVDTPYVPPVTVVAHTLAFQRSLLFDATAIAALTPVYAAALRTVLAGVQDDQVAVAAQLLRDVDGAVVPARIATAFDVSGVAAGDVVVDVTFTTTSTESVPVTVADVEAASQAILDAFAASAYAATASSVSAEERILDGECAYRCGQGCALCVNGEMCYTDEDCVDGHCNDKNVCGPDSKPNPQPDNSAAPTTYIAALWMLFMVFYFMI